MPTAPLFGPPPFKPCHHSFSFNKDGQACVTVSVTSFICLCYAASLIRSYLLFISTFDALTLYTAICPIYRCTSFISMFHSYLSPQTLTYHCCSATDRYSTYCAYTA